MASSQNAHLRRVHDSIKHNNNNNHNKKKISEIFLAKKHTQISGICILWSSRIMLCANLFELSHGTSAKIKP